MSTTLHSPSAGSRVAQTPELLEEILLYLDDGGLNHLRSLLHSQRVSHQFRAIVQESPKLSRALMISPTPGGTLRTSIYNPLLPIGSTPMTFQLGAFTFAIDTRPKSNEQGAKDLHVSFDLYREDPEARTIQAGGSWRSMYLMNCEYRVIEVGRRALSEEWQSPTLGELVDLVFSPMRSENLYSTLFSNQTKAEAEPNRIRMFGDPWSRISAAPRLRGWFGQQKVLQQICSTATVEGFGISRD